MDMQKDRRDPRVFQCRSRLRQLHTDARFAKAFDDQPSLDDDSIQAATCTGWTAVIDDTPEEAGTSHFLVQRAVRQPGHCGIENMVRQPAFDDLVNWIENRAEPAGDDVLGDVSQLGVRWTPLRHPKDPQR